MDRDWINVTETLRGRDIRVGELDKEIQRLRAALEEGKDRENLWTEMMDRQTAATEAERAKSAKLVVTLKRVLAWAKDKHEMPHYSEMIYDAEAAIREYNGEDAK